MLSGAAMTRGQNGNERFGKERFDCETVRRVSIPQYTGVQRSFS